MRTFDYQNLQPYLFEGEIGEASVKVFEDRGKFEILKHLHADRFDAMRKQAHIDNVDASTRVEGLYVGDARTRDLLAGAQPDNETESQIIGYSNALELVARDHSELDLSTASIIRLFETLYAHRDLGRKSRYRKKDYMYVQVDGRVEALPVSPITAFETPLVLGGACDSLAEAFGADAYRSLILNAVFTVDFLCIRPFEEGNGRISRLFADLMLMKSGFDISRYVSIDRIIENSGMDYYNALNSCVEGWDRARNDYAPYISYWLEVVHEAYQRAFSLIEEDVASQTMGKSERVRVFVERASEPVSKRQIREALPDVSEATIEAVLGEMVKEGIVEKVGGGRSTAYRPLKQDGESC